MRYSLLIFYLVTRLTLLPLTVAVKEIHLMGLIPMTGDMWPGGGACLPATEMALRHVNAREDILSDYKLNLIWRDTQCHIGKAINVMYEMLYTKPIKHMVLGPACSVEAEVTAQASPAWNITHLSYAGASPLLSDRKKFPRFFRTLSSDTRYNLLRLALAREFGWKRIATLNVALDYFSAITDNLVKSVQGTDISIISQEIFDHDPFTRLQSLKQKNARIILVASYANHARRIICAAFKVGLYGAKIVWMFPGWFTENWWVDPNNEVPCTREEMDEVVEGSFLTGFFTYNVNVAESGIANLTVQEFHKRFVQEKSYRQESASFEFISGNCYDAVWGIALALNCTWNILEKSGHPKFLEQFEYSDIDIADAMTSCMGNQSFIGISGHVQFGEYGDSIKKLRLDQIQGGKKVMVGVYRTDVDEPFIEWLNGGIQWKDGIPPRDSTLITNIEALIPANLYIIMSFLSGLGILLANLFFMFSLFYRNHVYVKLSSPNINNVLLLGCVIIYSCVFMVSLEEETLELCKLRTCTLTVGFSMAFGAMFSKTWRVYRIFSNKRLLQIRIKDSQLIGIVLLMVVVPILVLMIWEFIDPLFIVIKYLKSEVYATGNDAEIHMFIRVCTSRYSNYFTWSIYIWEGLLLSFGAFLAFVTRNVKIAALNDSRLIGACLYNVVVLSALCLTLNLVLEDHADLSYGILSAILVTGTTTTQLVVFIPKIMAVYHPHSMAIYPEGVTDKGQSIPKVLNARYRDSFSPRDAYNSTSFKVTKQGSSSDP